MSRPAIVKIGRRFDRWCVLAKAAPTAGGQTRALCVCDCGRRLIVGWYSLTKGTSRSCGCLRDELRKTHGLRATSEYSVWSALKDRCTNPKNPGWYLYGGRGIRVCARWCRSFAAFIADVGRRPSLRHSIDRFPDRDGNYKPGNVRWATATEQAQNTARNRYITVDGVTRCLTEWARTLGTNPRRIYTRIATGWPEELAVTVPINQRQRLAAPTLTVAARRARGALIWVTRRARHGTTGRSS